MIDMGKKRRTKPKATVEGQAPPKPKAQRKGKGKARAKTPEQVQAATEAQQKRREAAKRKREQARAKVIVQKARAARKPRVELTGPRPSIFQEIIDKMDDAVRKRDRDALKKLVEPIKTAQIPEQYREELKRMYKMNKSRIYLATQSSGPGVARSKEMARYKEKQIRESMGGRGRAGSAIVMNKAMQIHVMMNMMLARGMIPDEVLLDDWTEQVDETLTPEENLLLQLQEAAEQRGEGVKVIEFLGPTLKEQERDRRRAEREVVKLAKEKGITLPDDFREFVAPERGALANLETILGGGQEGTITEEGEFIPAYLLKGEEEGQGVGVWAPRLTRAKFKVQLGGTSMVVPLVMQYTPSSCGLASAVMAFAYKSYPAAKYFVELGDPSTEDKEGVQEAVQLGICHALLLVRHRPVAIAKLRTANLYTGFIRAQNEVLARFSTDKKLASAIAVYRREHVVLPALVRAYYARAYKTNHELHVIAWLCGFDLKWMSSPAMDVRSKSARKTILDEAIKYTAPQHALILGQGQSHWVTLVTSPEKDSMQILDPARGIGSIRVSDRFNPSYIFYGYKRLTVKQLGSRIALIAEKPAKPVKKPELSTDASIRKRLAAIDARMDALTRLARERMAKADEGARGRSPAEVDWLSSEERQELEALKHEYSALDYQLKGDVHERVAIKRELSNLKFTVDKDASMNELHAALEKARAIAKKRKERTHETFVFLSETKVEPAFTKQERHVIFAVSLHAARKQVEERLIKQYHDKPHRMKLIERMDKASTEPWQSFNWRD